MARQIEQRVVGGDWGANGYTTMAQADTLADGQSLSAGDRLLDLGTGRGWPGLYLATRTATASSVASSSQVNTWISVRRPVQAREEGIYRNLLTSCVLLSR